MMTFAFALSLYKPDELFQPSPEFRRFASHSGLQVPRTASRSDVAQWALALGWAEKTTIIRNGRSIEVFDRGQGYWQAFYVPVRGE